MKGYFAATRYRALAEFRYQIRRFLNFSERAARAAGLEPRQHQLLLGLKGMPEGRPATIGELAEQQCIRHHSAVGLVDRSVRRGLVRRVRNQLDHRQVLVHITSRGDRLLRRLSMRHLAELRSAGPALVRALNALIVRGENPHRHRSAAREVRRRPRKAEERAA